MEFMGVIAALIKLQSHSAVVVSAVVSQPDGLGVLNPPLVSGASLSVFSPRQCGLFFFFCINYI